VELLLAAIAVWLVLAVGLGVLLGRAARDAEVAELAPARRELEPVADAPPAAADLDSRVG
jgi:hypothetical protein